MKPSQWEKVKSILDTVLQRPAEGRRALVHKLSGGDTEVEEEVFRLLAEHDRMPSDFLNSSEDASSPLDLVGATLGDYRLVERLGQGGMGAVYRAIHTSNGTTNAVKVLLPFVSTYSRYVAYFRREVLALSKMAHPGIVQIRAFGEARGLHYVAMDYLGGGSLAERIEQWKKETVRPGRPHDESAALVAEVAATLHACHEKGVIHRDVSPSNILFDDAGRPRLVDFGIAKVLELEDFTRTRELFGNPFYMSPEQARMHRGRIDHRTDIYSLGAVLYEMLTLSRPFEGDQAHEVLLRIVRDQPASLRSLDRGIPDRLAAVCMTAMSKRSEYRYSDAREMSEDLLAFIDGRPVKANRQSLVARVRRGEVSRREAIMVAAGGVAFVSAAVTLGALRCQRLRRQATLRIRPRSQAPGLRVGAVPLLGPESFGEELRLKPYRSSRQEYSVRIPEGRWRVRFVDDQGGSAEFERDLQRAESYVLEPRLLRQEDCEGMVYVPAGTQSISIERQGRVAYEGVADVAGFWIDQAVVTNADYERFLVASKRDRDPWIKWPEVAGVISRERWEQLPATRVSWVDAVAYAEWAGKRLPTIGEWQHAMTGGDMRWFYPGGVQERFNLGKPGRSDFRGEESTFGAYLQHVEPASFVSRRMGPLRIAHPFGNVYEWTSTPAILPGGEQRLGLRILKGFCWHTRRVAPERYIRAYSSAGVDESSPDIGFRCVRSALGGAARKAG